MPGYEPVTLDSVCNAGVEALEDAAGDLPIGKVTFAACRSSSVPTRLRRSAASSSPVRRCRSTSAVRPGG